MSDIIPSDALAYLATPYRHWPTGINGVYFEAARIAGLLIRTGIKVFSPIAHGHPIAGCASIDPHDMSIWGPLNEKMMSRSDVLIVANLDGWQQSLGVTDEIKFFRLMRKPIFDLDPKTMVMMKRKPVKPQRERYEMTADELAAVAERE